MAKDKSIPSNLVFTREKFKYDTIEDMRNDVALKELVILDVDIKDMETGKKTGTETKAFARRVGQPNWLMEFNETEYVL